MFKKFEPYAYALLRIVTGFLFVFHGLPKLAPLLDGNVGTLLTQRGLAGIIEVFGGGLVMIGLFTSPVAFLCSGQMAVAYFQAHFPRAFWPIDNGGELAALYCFAFLFISMHGAGKWSVGR
jgi:putative oxidoreductase